LIAWTRRIGAHNYLVKEKRAEERPKTERRQGGKLPGRGNLTKINI
jgi:hypothetical protein